MNLDASFLDKIDDYLSGKLPPDEAMALEQKSAVDPETAEAIEFMRLEREGMELILEERLREKMGGWEEELPTPKTNLSRYGWVLGAAFALLIAVAVWRWAASDPQTISAPDPAKTPANTVPAPGQPDAPIAQQPDNQIPTQAPPGQKPSSKENRYLALAQASYQSPDFSNIRKGGADASGSPSLIEQAAAFYIQKKFALAAQTLDSIPPNQRTDALKIRAHAFFNLKNYNLAAVEFEDLTKTGGRYRNDAEWHLLLCYLALLPAEQARFDTLLRKIRDPQQSHPFADKATALQKVLAAGR